MSDIYQELKITKTQIFASQLIIKLIDEWWFHYFFLGSLNYL